LWRHISWKQLSAPSSLARATRWVCRRCMDENWRFQPFVGTFSCVLHQFPRQCSSQWLSACFSVPPAL
jgi:hypothetical protein